MATKTKPKKRATALKRGRGLGEADAPIIRVSNRENVAGTLLKRKADDSVLKTVVVWGLAIGGAYFGSKMLLKVVGKDIAESRETNARNDVLTNATTPEKHPADGLAIELAKAINPDWIPSDPKAVPSMFTEADEFAVFRILAGGNPERELISRKIIVKPGPSAKIVSREYFAEVNRRYQALTGRTLDYDLYNYLDPPYSKNDYDALKPYIAKIMCKTRVVDRKTKAVTYKKIC